jgi:hypothetical protein
MSDKATDASVAMARRNARISKMEGEAQKTALLAKADTLAKSQRELKAQQRVSVASTGADLSEEQPLAILEDQANKMQMDLLELQRQGTIAKQRGESGSLLSLMQGDQSKMQGYANMAISGYNLWKARQ